MGAGKTAATLQALSEKLEKNPNLKILISAPLAVAKNVWPNEIKKWENFNHLKYSLCIGSRLQRDNAATCDHQIMIINHDNISWLVEHHTCDYDIIVIDESSCVRNPKTKRFKSFKKLRKNIKNFILLTGTPMPNSYLDLWAQIYLLDDGEKLGASYFAFTNRYFYQNFNGYGYTLKQGYDKVIKSKIQKRCVIVESYDSLPEKLEIDNYVELPQTVYRQYKELKKEFILETEKNDITALNAAVLVGKLHQFASGAIYDDNKDYIVLHEEKINMLKEIIEQSPDENILLAYNYRHELEQIKKHFQFAVAIKDEGAIEAWNEGDIKLLLCHPKSAAHGLNLQTGGRRIVWYSMTWSSELREQFNARLVRSGQQNKVIIHNIIASHTIDEDIVQKAGEKFKLEQLLIKTLQRKC